MLLLSHWESHKDDTVERQHPQEAQNHLCHALASSIKQQHFPRGLVTVSCKLRGGDTCPWEPGEPGVASDMLRDLGKGSILFHLVKSAKLTRLDCASLS